jgi:hypothetical protein
MRDERHAGLRRQPAAAVLQKLRGRAGGAQRALVERRKVRTRARDSSAALSSKEGFSVVAPTSVIVPSSMTGRKASCWARLKRWISSTKSSVPLPRRDAAARRFEHLLEVGDAGEDRADLLEAEIDLPRQQPRHRRLAGAGRAPEDQAAERARLHQPRQRAVRPGQVVLARDLAQRRRPHPVGERAWPGLVQPRGGEEIAHDLLIMSFRGAAKRRTRNPRPGWTCRCA